MVSGSEILIILLAVFLLFGTKKLPEIARGLGKGINELKKIGDDIKKEINKDSSNIPNKAEELNETISGITKEINNTKEMIIKDELKG